MTSDPVHMLTPWMWCRMYAFDVHCNSYFPLFILLYGEGLLSHPTLVTCPKSCLCPDPGHVCPATMANRLLQHCKTTPGMPPVWRHLKQQGPRDLTAVLVPCAVLQFVLSPVLLWRSFVSTVLANVLYMIALSYYHYLSFLGYSALPFLEHTEVFLWPVAAIVLVVPFAVLAGFNPSRFTLNIYFG